MDNLLAVILGGGDGSCLAPLTRRRSTPAVPLAGKYRLIDIPISNCINSGMNRIFVLTQFNSASLNRHVANTYTFDRFRYGFVSILAAEQTAESLDWSRGSADSVRKSLPHLHVFHYDDVLILTGDQLYLMDYRRLLEHHRRTQADLTLASVPVTALDAPSFGILKTDDDGLVQGFVEQPTPDRLNGMQSPVPVGAREQGRVYLASMGVYLFRRQALMELLQEKPEHMDFGRDLIPQAIRTRRVSTYVHDGYWSNIGSIRSFYSAHLQLAQRGSEFNLYSPEMPVYTNARVLPPAKIEQSYITDSLIGEGSIIINSQISNAVVGIRSFIGYNTTVKNAIIMGSDYFPWHDPDLREQSDAPRFPGIGEASYIDNAIIDKNVSIGKRCILCNRDGVREGERGSVYFRDGILIVAKNASIPDDTII